MTVNAVERCIGVLECLAGEAGGLDLGVIAQRVGMPKSATHRLLATLQQRGWVTQDARTHAYVLSLRFGMLALRNLDARVATDVVQPVLDRLARRTREYARLAVVEGDGLTWVARAQGAVSGLRYDPDMGNEVTLHATATGKAWLATLPEDEALRIVAAQGLDGHVLIGPNAARTMEEVRAALETTRRQGYGAAIEEGERGIVSLAVTFRTEPSEDAPAAGTLSIAGPAARMGPERHAEIVAALREAAREMDTMWLLRTRRIHGRVPPAAAPGADGVAGGGPARPAATLTTASEGGTAR